MGVADTVGKAEPGEGRWQAQVREVATGLGFSRVGFAHVNPSDHAALYRNWVRRGLHGEMSYLARTDAMERRFDLRGTLPKVRSAVVVAHDYGSTAPEAEPTPPDTPRWARYARGRDYHRVMTPRLRRLHRGIQGSLGEEVAGRAYVDTGPLLERELAARAGLGWFGRNTMLIHPTTGSYFFLGVLLLDLELAAPDAPVRDHCGTCRACLDACPTRALLGRDEQGAPIMDARRCISYLTIELRGPIPREFRSAIGNRIFGCDICQEVCPFNGKFAREPVEVGYAETSVAVPLPLSLIQLADATQAEWDGFTRGRPIRRAGYDGLRRNAMVGLGNWGAPEALPALLRGLRDASPLVRSHAAWGLGRIPGERARDTLVKATRSESDPLVRSEIDAALDGMSDAP